MLLQCQERDNGLRPNANKTRHPPLKHPPHALGAENMRQQMHNPLIIMRAHHPRLYNIHRRAYRRRHESRHNTCAEMREHVVLHARVLQQRALKSIVRGELPDRHEQGARGIGTYAAPEGCKTFFALHAEEAVEYVFVVSPLFEG